MRVTPAMAALVLANLVPLVGVLALRWSLAEILLVYWTESAIIGVFTVAKMALTRSWKALGAIPFFCVHYGIFMAGHLAFIVLLFFRLDGADVASTVPRLGIAALALFASHGVSFVQNHLRGGERERLSLEAIMGAPYPRIVVMHVTILVGAGVTLALGSPLPALALLIALKTAVDLRAHLKERARASSTTRTQPA